MVRIGEEGGTKAEVNNCDNYICVSYTHSTSILQCLRKQIVPFPVYPWLHVQVKLPGVLVQLALESQLLVVASAHSSISDTVKSLLA